MTNPAPVLSGLARWAAAVICVIYGFAKINGAQFTVLDSELTRPLGEVSGFWLTWYYFAYSPAYGTIIALVQILSSVLLVVPRTALLGALILLPVATNIALIDLLYGVDLGGTVAALVLLACVVAIVVPHLPRLRAAVLAGGSNRAIVGPLAAWTAIGLTAFVFTGWTAHYNNRAPTPIDGVWTVTHQSDGDGAAAAKRWQNVFFEYNRAHLAVFRADVGPDDRHHFEVDSDGVVRVWQQWLSKGPMIMEGRRTSETEIELFAVEGGERLLLRRTQLGRPGQ